MLDCAADGIGQNTSYTVGDFASHLGPISKRDLVCCLFMYVAQHNVHLLFVDESLSLAGRWGRQAGEIGL